MTMTMTIPTCKLKSNTHSPGGGMKKAYGYIRVSGKGQTDGDGFDRQIKAINHYAKANGLEVVHIFREKGVSGTLQDRPALTGMMLDLKENGHDIHTVIIERIDRLARDLMVQENLLYDMGKHGVSVLSATDGDLLEDDPTRKLVRQVLVAIAEYDKTMLVLKLKASRDRIKARDWQSKNTRRNYCSAKTRTANKKVYGALF